MREPAPEGIRHEDGRLLERGLCRVHRNCLKLHGVTLPSGSFAATTSTTLNTKSVSVQKALAACASLRPKGFGTRPGRLFERGPYRVPQLPEAPRRDVAQRVFRPYQFDHFDHAQHEEHVRPEGARRLRKSPAEVHSAAQHKLDVDDKLIGCAAHPSISPVSPYE